MSCVKVDEKGDSRLRAGFVIAIIYMYFSFTGHSIVDDFAYMPSVRCFEKR